MGREAEAESPCSTARSNAVSVETVGGRGVGGGVVVAAHGSEDGAGSVGP